MSKILPMPPPSVRYRSVYPHLAHDTAVNLLFCKFKNRERPDPVVLISPVLYSVELHFAQEYWRFVTVILLGGYMLINDSGFGLTNRINGHSYKSSSKVYGD